MIINQSIQKKKKKKKRRKKREMIILKSESKPDGGRGGGGGGRGLMMMIKNMVQIHDEQRSIQMTMLHRDIQIYTYTQKHCLDKHCDYK